MALTSPTQSTPNVHVQTVEDRIAAVKRIAAGMRVKQPKGIRRPPGPGRAETLVAALSGRISTLSFMGKLFAADRISYVKVATEHLYGLSDPELIWEVFAKHDSDTARSMGLQMTRPVLGNGILTSEEPEHRRNRALVQPAFSPRRVGHYADEMVDATYRVDELWQERTKNGSARIVVSDEMSDLTLDIVGRTLFGADLTSDASEISDALTEVLGRFGQMLSPMGIILMRTPSPTRKRMIAAIHRLDAVVERLIKEKRETLAAGAEPDDMLSVLIAARDPETGQGLSMDELRDEAMTLVLAGHETTANALSWTWLELSKNPSVRSWVEEEWDAIAADHRLGMADVAALPRTRAVVAESMRLNPPAWIVGRRLTRDIELAGYQIPRGSTMFASQYFLQRDPRFWANATTFDPTRWIDGQGDFDEKAPGQPKASWFPFGFASRKCIGDRFALTEAVLALATLGRGWQIDAIEPQEVAPIPAITLRPGNGVPARLRRRRVARV